MIVHKINLQTQNNFSESSENKTDLRKKIIKHLEKIGFTSNSNFSSIFLNKVIFSKKNIDIDFTVYFQDILKTVKKTINEIINNDDAFKKQKFYVEIKYLDENVIKNFVINIKINGVNTTFLSILAEVKFKIQNTYDNIDDYNKSLNNLQLYNKGLINDLSPQDIEQLKNNIQFRINRFQSINDSFENTKIKTKLLAKHSKTDNVDNSFEFSSPFLFDFKSDDEDEKVSICGINLEVKNKHFSFNLKELIKKDDTQQTGWNTSKPLELVITKFRKQTGEVIFEYKEQWSINSSVSDSNFKLLNWTPNTQYSQFKLISEWITDVNRNIILDVNGKKIPNPDYDKFINPKTGTKTTLAWISLPSKSFLVKYNNLNQFDKEKINEVLGNKFSLEKGFYLNEYYQNNNLPLGTYARFLDKKILDNTDYEINLKQGIIADSISTHAGIEYLIPKNADLVIVYKLNINSAELDFEKFADGNYVKVLRNSEKKINNSFLNFYHSEKGNYLIASSKHGGESNFLLLNMNPNNENTSKEANFVQAVNKPYFEEFWKTKASKYFKQYLQVVQKLSVENIELLSYFDVMNYWKLYEKYSKTLNGINDIFKIEFGTSIENVLVNIPKIKTKIYQINQAEFYLQNIFFASAVDEFNNLIKQYNKKLQLYKDNRNTKNLELELKTLKKELDNIISVEVNKNEWNERIYNSFFIKNSDNNSKINAKISQLEITPLAHQGNNDYYSKYRYVFTFESEYLTLETNKLEIILKFNNDLADKTKPDTDIESKFNNPAVIEIRNKFIYNDKYINSLTKNIKIQDFNHTIFISQFNHLFFIDLIEDEFKKYKFKKEVIVDDENIFLKISITNKSNITAELDYFKLKFYILDITDLFSALNINTINLYTLPQKSNFEDTFNEIKIHICKIFESSKEDIKSKAKENIDYEYTNDINYISSIYDLTKQINPIAFFELKIKSIVNENNPWKKDLKTIKIINDKNITNLSNIKLSSIVINKKLQLIDLTNFLINEIKTSIKQWNMENKKQKIQFNDFDFTKLESASKSILYSKNIVENLLIQIMPKNQFLYKYLGNLNIQIENNIIKNNLENIADIFTFKSININATTFKDAISKIFSFLKNKENVYDFILNQDFTIKELKNILSWLDSNYWNHSHSLINLDSSFSDVIKALNNLKFQEDYQKYISEINAVIEIIKKHDDFDYLSKESKHKLISDFSDFLTTIKFAKDVNFSQEKKHVLNLFKNSKTTENTLFSDLFKQKEKSIEIINIAKTTINIAQIEKEIDKEINNAVDKKIKSFITKYEKDLKEIFVKETTQIETKKFIKKRNSIIVGTSIGIGFFITLITTIFWIIKRKSKIKINKFKRK